MKTVQRNILISLVPLLTPLTAFAEIEEKTSLISPISQTKSMVNAWRASEVIGQNVKNAGDETVGEVQDLLVDMKSGEILAVIVSAGGFLGIGDVLTSVPVSALRFDVDAKAFKTKLTKEQLEKAPQFNTTTWPDFNNAITLETLRSYRDSIRGSVTDPDNSAHNNIAKNTNIMIPTDQGNSEKDIQITKDIYASVVSSNMSYNAKNIKIITKNEHVVLKGLVDSASEHQAVIKIARNHTNVEKITDHLKVSAE